MLRHRLCCNRNCLDLGNRCDYQRKSGCYGLSPSGNGAHHNRLTQRTLSKPKKLREYQYLHIKVEFLQDFSSGQLLKHMSEEIIVSCHEPAVLSSKCASSLAQRSPTKAPSSAVMDQTITHSQYFKRSEGITAHSAHRHA